jgi:hypothetical protein
MKFNVVFKSIILCAMLVLLTVTPVLAGAHSFTIAWVGPTTEILANDCTKVGAAITKPFTYTVAWRVTGAPAWTTAEVVTPPYTITNLLGDTIYEVQVGAHYSGGTVFCFSSPLSVRTLADQPPAACTSVTPSNIQ